MSEKDKSLELSGELLESCELCPRACRVNRLAGEVGFCRTAQHAGSHIAHVDYRVSSQAAGRSDHQ